MTPILQTGIEVTRLFSTTVEHAQQIGGFDVCINAQWYGLSIGTDANEGVAVLGTGRRYGNEAPLLWSVSQTSNYEWAVNFGNPPESAYTGIGGLCPLIVDGLNYGTKNEYEEANLVNPILRGEPHPHHKQFLIQRSSKKFEVLDRARNKGKAGFGVCAGGEVVIIVEQDDTAELSYTDFRDLFVERNCIHAMACDGSDSVFLYYKGEWKVEAGGDKDLTQTSGLGFRIDYEL